jgi:hypothetical protein
MANIDNNQMLAEIKRIREERLLQEQSQSQNPYLSPYIARKSDEYQNQIAQNRLDAEKNGSAGTLNSQITPSGDLIDVHNNKYSPANALAPNPNSRGADAVTIDKLSQMNAKGLEAFSASEQDRVQKSQAIQRAVFGNDLDPNSRAQQIPRQVAMHEAELRANYQLNKDRFDGGSAMHRGNPLRMFVNMMGSGRDGVDAAALTHMNNTFNQNTENMNAFVNNRQAQIY